MMFINLTQHNIDIYTANYWPSATPPEDIVVAQDGTRYALVLSIPPQGSNPARVTAKSIPVERGFGFEVVTNTFGSVTGLPDPSPGCNYIVSGMVLDSLQGARFDVYAPGPLLRDENGQPIGCVGLRC